MRAVSSSGCRPLRIAFIGQKGFPATWGGVEVHVDALATRLAARGHDVTVYTRRWYGPGSSKRRHGVRAAELPTLRTKHLDCIVHCTLASLHAALTRKFDVVHYHGIGPSLTCWLPRGRPARIVATIHRHDYLARKWGTVARVALKLGERLAIAVPHHTLAVSRSLAESCSRDGRTCTYLPSGVEVRPRRPPRTIGSEWGLKGDDYLLSMARFTVDKGHAELISAFLSADTGGVKLVIAGEAEQDPGYSDRLRAAAGGSGRILFPGVIQGPRKEELLSNALGFVSRSTAEGLPLAVLEAMSYERVCLLSDIPAHREVVANGEAGILVPENVEGAWTRRIQELVRSGPADREAMGRRAREMVKRRYGWDRVVDRIERIYAGDNA